MTLQTVFVNDVRLVRRLTCIVISWRWTVYNCQTILWLWSTYYKSFAWAYDKI